MSGLANLTRFSRRRTVRLTTKGRRSGQSREVTVWFVLDGPHTLLIQHVAKKPAQWYRNLCADPNVVVDFGNWPIEATATPITDRAAVAEVMERVAAKYWTYRLIRLFGNPESAVAARIDLRERGDHADG